MLTALVGAPAATLASCPFGISPEVAQRVFEQVTAISPREGYFFDGIGTQKTEMVMAWTRNGEPCPKIHARLAHCASLLRVPTLELEVPPDLATRCPELEGVVRELRLELPAHDLAGRRRALPPAAFLLLIVIGGLAVGAFLWKRQAGGGSAVGWQAIAGLALVALAALPFLFDVLVGVTLDLGVAWLVFAALLVDRDRTRRGTSANDVWLTALFGFSLLLNWALSSRGPGDLHLNLASIWSSDLDLRWGPAPIALFRLIDVAIGGIRDTHIFWCNLILSSLLPVLLYRIVAQLGVSEGAALTAAWVTAAQPLLITFSGVLERQAAYRFAAFGSIAALIAFLKRGTIGSLLAFSLGAALAILSRPEGAHVLVVELAILLIVAAAWRRRLVAGLALAMLVGGAVAFLAFASDNRFPIGRNPIARFPLLWTVLFDGDFMPMAWIVLWIAGVVLGFRRRAAWIVLLTLLGLDLAWRWTGMYAMFVGNARQVASSRYESILLVPFAIGVALFVEAVSRKPAWLKGVIAAALVVATALTFTRPYQTLLAPFTVDYEYWFLKKYALTLPAHARLYVFDGPFDDMGFLDAHLVGIFVDGKADFGSWLERNCDDLSRDGSDLYLYVGSSCGELIGTADRQLGEHYGRWLQDCAEVRERLRGDLVEEREVPAHKLSWHEFKQPTVRLSLYRVRDPSICKLGPNSRSPEQAWAHSF